MKKAYLVLQNGKVFEGEAFGAEKPTVGELVFTTNMTGYMETLTDPSYYGQIIVQTFPMIGNYGSIPDDAESDGVYAFGYVVRELCDSPSNYRCKGKLGDYLAQCGIPGISGVDTRAITKEVRERGVMNAAIVYDLNELPDLSGYAVRGAVKATSKLTKPCATEHAGADDTALHIALIDYGAKSNIARCLTARGAAVTCFPHSVKAEEILSDGFDGVMLSNGPGDPKENDKEIAELKKLLGKLPVFGICLGHQLLALAVGGDTEKLKYGHRGGNQPVKDVHRGRVFITSQNHGYAVKADSLPVGAEISHINVNDGTVEGVSYAKLNALGVQFHPEAAGGPRDSEFLFDEFIKKAEEYHASR